VVNSGAADRIVSDSSGKAKSFSKSLYSRMGVVVAAADDDRASCCCFFGTSSSLSKPGMLSQSISHSSSESHSSSSSSPGVDEDDRAKRARGILAEDCCDLGVAGERNTGRRAGKTEVQPQVVSVRDEIKMIKVWMRRSGVDDITMV